MENKDLWFGAIPPHWTYDKIGILFSERRTKVSDKDYAPLSVARIGVVPQLATAVKTDAGDNRKLVCNGDFVINSRSDRKGSCGVADRDGSVSLINIVLTPRNEWNNRYVHYLMRSQPFSEEYYRYGRGIVADLWTTRYSEMKSILLPIPPRTEQDQIVRFLDWKVSWINRLIGIKRREIERIEELKKTITHFMVYGNENKENVSRWEMRRIKTLFDMRDERNYEPLQTVNLISVYSKFGVIQNKDIEYSMGNHARSAEGYKKVYENDIVVNIILCWMGAIGISAYNGVTSPAYDVYIPHKDVCGRYYHYLFRTQDFSDKCYKVGKGIMSMRWRVYSPQFRNIIVPFPPLSEQIKIAVQLDNKLQNMDKYIQSIFRQIATLQELKTRLIADTVTGKIDVRNIEIPEYEFVGGESQAEEEIDAEGSENEE